MAAEKLEDEEFEVERGIAGQRGIAGLETAFRRIHLDKSEGPTIVILSEYDALPEIGHACGHNLIAAGGLGAALALGRLKSKLPGTLQLICFVE